MNDFGSIFENKDNISIKDSPEKKMENHKSINELPSEIDHDETRFPVELERMNNKENDNNGWEQNKLNKMKLTDLDNNTLSTKGANIDNKGDSSNGDIIRIKNNKENDSNNAELSKNDESNENKPIESSDNNSENNSDSVESKTDNTSENNSDSAESKDDNTSETDNPENDKTQEFIEKLIEILSSSEKIKEILENDPKLKERLEKYLEIINNPDKYTPAEINNALRLLKTDIKGKIFEKAVIEALKSIGLDVDESQKLVEGETGGTKPDAIACNNTNKPIILFGKTINPGDRVFVECKCGKKNYMNTQLKSHLPNQLSGHDGVSLLITTSDMNECDTNLIKDVISPNNTVAVILNISAEDIDNSLKEDR